jgi:hypothetical protein
MVENCFFSAFGILHERMVAMKKVIVLLAVIALSASLAIGVTTAFTSTVGEDSSDVMTVGNVDIAQLEKTRNHSGKLVDFRNDKFLLPAVYHDGFDLTKPDQPIDWPTGGTSLLWDDSKIQNVIDKFVFVENVGKSPAYVRTWIAFESGPAMVHKNLNTTEWEWSNEQLTMTIAGRSFHCLVGTYIGSDTVHPGGILPPGETTRPSLLQVATDKTATYESISQYGESYDIMVVSQAVQTEGFDNPQQALDAAFQKIQISNHPWKDLQGLATSVGTLKSSLEKGGSVMIGADLNIVNAGASGKNTMTRNADVDFDDYTVTLNLPDATQQTVNRTGITVGGGNVTFSGRFGGIATAANPYLAAAVVQNGASLTVNGGNYIGGTSAMVVEEGTLTVNGGYFEAQLEGRAFTIRCEEEAYLSGAAKVIIQGGDFLNWNPADNDSQGDGTSFLAEGYTVVSYESDQGTLYSVVKE